MGFVRNLITKPAQGSASVSPPAGGSPVHDGRGRLRIAAAELAKAKDCVNDLEARLNRLTTIIGDADAAHTALQAAITADGGVALEAYAAGNASDQPIAKLVATKETTARAASAARDALPGVNDMLAKARAEEARLEAARFDAVIVYLKMRASDDHKSFTRAFRDLCDSYDALCGIAVAVAATGHSEMMTTGLPVTLQVPNFNMGTGPAHGPNERTVMQHNVADAKISNATSKWMQARERLIADADADLEDLI
jgi:hypothetical protein